MELLFRTKAGRKKLKPLSDNYCMEVTLLQPDDNAKKNVSCQVEYMELKEKTRCDGTLNC